jgi:2-phospho-L-lactate guanylyltransferase
MQWIVIPYRGPAGAKTRLAGAVSDAARQQISRAMFQHVLNVACTTVGARRVLVVTASHTASAIARRAGACVLRERQSGLNAAVAQACASLRNRGATTAAIVAADLPLLNPANLIALNKRASEGCIGIAPDRAGTGTNAIALPLGAPFAFRFGTDSFRQHCDQLREGVLAVRAIRQPELAADVDVAGDLSLLDHPSALATLPVVAAASYRVLG